MVVEQKGFQEIHQELMEVVAENHYLDQQYHQPVVAVVGVVDRLHTQKDLVVRVVEQVTLLVKAVVTHTVDLLVQQIRVSLVATHNLQVLVLAAVVVEHQHLDLQTPLPILLVLAVQVKHLYLLTVQELQ